MRIATEPTAVTSPASEDMRWASVVARDSQADGAFYYSVKTTGVYCKPSCAARLPRPDNVAFHLTREEAEGAGFRPCQRCKPRMEKPIIRFGIGTSSLGLVLVAQSERGVCAVLLGDEADALTRDLRKRFPRALPRDGGNEFELIVSRVIGLMESQGGSLDVPLDWKGTAFQKRVWEAIRQIPSGATASYTEIANRIGSPKSVRAVAQACAANPVAIVTPCHRVVRTDGGLSGYRWGVERKRLLLAREARS